MPAFATPFAAALADLRQRQLLPTSLDSAAYAELPQWVRDQAFLSSQVATADILAALQENIDRLLGGGDRGPGMSMDPALFRVGMRDMLAGIDYAPANPDDVGTIKDLRSNARLNVIVRTQEEMATGHGQYLQSIDQDAVDLWPAWELIRVRNSRVPRDWEERWTEAAATSGDSDAVRMLSEHGRMIARKDSPIWISLSRFGRPHPPFDYNSGMGVEDIDHDECIALGLIGAGDRVQAPDPAGPPTPQAATDGLPGDLRSAIAANLGDKYRMDASGVLHAA